jgi:hypothetical protein
MIPQSFLVSTFTLVWFLSFPLMIRARVHTKPSGQKNIHFYVFILSPSQPRKHETTNNFSGNKQFVSRFHKSVQAYEGTGQEHLHVNTKSEKNIRVYTDKTSKKQLKY